MPALVMDGQHKAAAAAAEEALPPRSSTSSTSSRPSMASPLHKRRYPYSDDDDDDNDNNADGHDKDRERTHHQRIRSGSDEDEQQQHHHQPQPQQQQQQQQEQQQRHRWHGLSADSLFSPFSHRTMAESAQVESLERSLQQSGLQSPTNDTTFSSFAAASSSSAAAAAAATTYSMGDGYRHPKRKMSRSPSRGLSESPDRAARGPYFGGGGPANTKRALVARSPSPKKTPLSPTRRHALPFVEKQIHQFLQKLAGREKTMREAFPIINRKEALRHLPAYNLAERLHTPAGRDTYSLNRVRPHLHHYKQEAMHGCSVLMTRLHPLPDDPRPLLELFLTDLLPPLCQSILRLPEFEQPDPTKEELLHAAADIYTQVLQWLLALLSHDERVTQRDTPWRIKLLFLCSLPVSGKYFEPFRTLLQAEDSDVQAAHAHYTALTSMPEDQLPSEWRIMNGGIIR